MRTIKKIALFSVMALLCFSLKGQEQGTSLPKGDRKGIQVGEKVPDLLLTNLHFYKDQKGRELKNARLSDFKGKLLILDFWATWCAPCVSMLPKMESLQKEFGDQLQFLSVTYQKEQEVLPFLHRLAKQTAFKQEIPMLTDHGTLHELFPHVYLPHYVWINREGKVIAITGKEEVTKDNIETALLNKGNVTHLKADQIVKYNRAMPLFIDGNGFNQTVIKYLSVLSKYTEGIGAGYQFSTGDKISEGKITARNLSIAQLFGLAYGEGYKFSNRKRLYFEVANNYKLTSPKIREEHLDWRLENSYCYELIMNNESGRGIFEEMRFQLGQLFPGYQVSIQYRMVKCLALRRTSSTDLIATKGGERETKFTHMNAKLRNAPIDRLSTQLETVFMQKSPYFIINDTGYLGMVDLDVEANLSDIDKVNESLSKYHLKFELGEYMQEVLVFTDKDWSLL